jgi:hypothetical protein
MDNDKKTEKIVISVGPPNNPYGKIIRTERRFWIKDRRREYIYIADDRRKGFADRRDNERFSLVQ